MENKLLKKIDDIKALPDDATDIVSLEEARKEIDTKCEEEYDASIGIETKVWKPPEMENYDVLEAEWGGTDDLILDDRKWVESGNKDIALKCALNSSMQMIGPKHKLIALLRRVRLRAREKLKHLAPHYRIAAHREKVLHDIEIDLLCRVFERHIAQQKNEAYPTDYQLDGRIYSPSRRSRFHSSSSSPTKRKKKRGEAKLQSTLPSIVSPVDRLSSADFFPRKVMEATQTRFRGSVLSDLSLSVSSNSPTRKKRSSKKSWRDSPIGQLQILLKKCGVAPAQLFQYMDTNGTNTITQVDLQIGLKQAGLHMNDSDIVGIFDTLAEAQAVQQLRDAASKGQFSNISELSLLEENQEKEKKMEKAAVLEVDTDMNSSLNSFSKNKNNRSGSVSGGGGGTLRQEQILLRNKNMSISFKVWKKVMSRRHTSADREDVFADVTLWMKALRHWEDNELPRFTLQEISRMHCKYKGDYRDFILEALEAPKEAMDFNRDVGGIGGTKKVVKKLKTRNQIDGWQVGLFDAETKRKGERKIKISRNFALPEHIKYSKAKSPANVPMGFDPQLIVRSAQTPKCSLELDWVHGYAGDALGPNLFYTKQAELVYFVAAAGIILDLNGDGEEFGHHVKTQKVFTGHTSDITCIAVHPSEKYACTGQASPGPHMRIWRLSDAKLIANIGWVLGEAKRDATGNMEDPKPEAFYKGLICACCFAGVKSELLIGVGGDDHHTIGVWNWINGQLLAIYPLNCIKLYQISAASEECHQETIGGGGILFSTCGVGHLKFWKGTSVEVIGKNASYGEFDSPRAITSVFYMPSGTVAAGGDNGDIYIFDARHTCLTAFSAHTGPVFSITLQESEDGDKAKDLMISGGADGNVKVWRQLLDDKVFDDDRSMQSSCSTALSRSSTALSLRGRIREANEIAVNGKITIQKSELSDHEDKELISQQPETHLRWTVKREYHIYHNINHHGTTIHYDKPPIEFGENSDEVEPPNHIDIDAEKLFGGLKGRGSVIASDGKAPKNWGRSSPGLIHAGSRAIRALTCGHGGDIAIGLASGEIWVLDPEGNKGNGTLRAGTRGHAMRINGLSCHPTLSHFYATAAHDSILGVWDARRRDMVRHRELPFPAHCLDYSNNGRYIAVGFVNGSFGVYNSLTFVEVTIVERPRQVSQWKDQTEEIPRCDPVTVIKWSPNDNRIAVGSTDTDIDVWVVVNLDHFEEENGKTKMEKHDADTNNMRFRLDLRLKGHSGSILHIDWSKDNMYLQSQCASRELLRWNLQDRSEYGVKRGQLLQSTLAQSLIKWHSWTCTIGFPVMGIYPDGSDTHHVNCCDVSGGGEIVMTGDVDGLLKLLNHPCVVEDAPSKEYLGHSTKVANCVFTRKNEYAVSVGSDSCVFQYKVNGINSDGREF
eukprot:g3130.t1